MTQQAGDLRPRHRGREGCREQVRLAVFSRVRCPASHGAGLKAGSRCGVPGSYLCGPSALRFLTIANRG